MLLGYAGYITGVKSENVYGTTFGKSTYASAAKSFHSGIDEPAHLKFNTSMKSQFIDHSTKTYETVAQIVGVHKENTRFQRVSYLFYE